MFVGNGSLQSKEIIFASKEADLLQYEASPALFVDQQAWSKWKTKAAKVMDSKVATGVSGQMAEMLDHHEIFELPSTGTLVANSGLQKTYPAECQSSVVLNKNQPSPQFLVTETNVAQKSISNGKLTTNTTTYTDVLAETNGAYKMVGAIDNGQVPPCVD